MYNQFAAVGEETTWGSSATRNKFAKIMQGSFLEHMAERDISARLAANAGADPEGVFDKGQRGEGKLILPLSYDDGLFQKILKHAIGTVATTGAGPYTHTFTRSVNPSGGAVSSAVSLSVELNGELPDAGPLEARLLLGGRVKTMNLSWNAGEEVVGEFDLIGKSVTQVTKTASPTYPVYDTYQMLFTHAALTIGGTAYTSVCSGLDLTLDNGHEPRIRLGSSTTQNPVRRGKSSITGNVRLDWQSSPAAKTIWDAYVANTTLAFVVTLTGPTNYSMVVTLNTAKITSARMSPEEGELQSCEFGYSVLHDATNTAIKIALQNQTSTT